MQREGLRCAHDQRLQADQIRLQGSGLLRDVDRGVLVGGTVPLRGYCASVRNGQNSHFAIHLTGCGAFLAPAVSLDFAYPNQCGRDGRFRIKFEEKVSDLSRTVEHSGMLDSVAGCCIRILDVYETKI